MLPYSLFCLLQVIFSYAQQDIPLDSSVSLSNSSTVSIPPSAGLLAISVAVCSTTLNPPRFLFANNTQTGTLTLADVGNAGVFEIEVADGIGDWSGFATNGGVLSTFDVGNTSYEVGVSTGDPIHQYLVMKQQYPLFGDSTSNQALVFSPVFETIAMSVPSYPNYSLPSAQSPFLVPTSPSSQPQFDLVLLEPSSTSSISKSGCALTTIKSAGSVTNQSNWLKDEDGWRSKWYIEGLTPNTNYTTYVVQDGTKVSGPTYFITKSASFACPLVNSLPYCPSVSWTVPLPQTPDGIYDTTNLPDTISGPLEQYMTNFTTMLLTFPCGRDIYSPRQTCADCQREYRKWLCMISFPRCGENPNPPSTLPTPALLAQPISATPRNPTFPIPQSAYNELLPCIETCQSADRACPHFIGFQCPLGQFNAQSSYGVGYIDSGGDRAGDGSTGAAQDTFGNVWCNAG